MPNPILYLVVRNSYGDFDITQQQALAGSVSKPVADHMATSLNANRTEEQLNSEVSYTVVMVQNLDR